MKTAVVALVMTMSLAAGERASGAEVQMASAYYPLAAGGKVSVENVKGDVAVEGWDRDEVEVTVVKTAPQHCACLGQARVLAVPGANAWSFATLYTGSVKAPVRVDYGLRVPRQVRLDGVSTLQGGIFVRDVDGTVHADTLSGDIQETGISGQAEATSLNGNIDVSLRRLADSGQALRLETINGSVAVILPQHANASIELSTVAGHIETPYALQASAVPGDSVRRTRLGNGNSKVLLRTVRGNIRLEEQNDTL